MITTPHKSENTLPMPLLFLGHGSPVNAIEKNQFTGGWRSIAESIPKPEAVLCISAHWETKGTFTTAMESPRTIHDFSGFPSELYEVQYPAPGSPELAVKTAELLIANNARPDYSWGFDHGCWSVMRHLYPEADIPVIQLSLDYLKPPAYHYNLARNLSALRNKGVLIIGSGNLVHNLGLIAWDKTEEPEYGYDWAIEANEKLKGFILSGDHEALTEYKSLGRAVSLAIPTPEHFLPLLYILALKSVNEKISFFNDAPVMGSLTMTSVKIEER